jgi:ubiquinone/menaquinone biosynthesis C-methylase UbiE
MAGDLKAEVRRYWEAYPCGAVEGIPTGSREYFDAVEAARWSAEPFIPAFAQFWRWNGRSVLEIGIGQGTDFIQFVRAGAHATGVDLTHASIELVAKRLALEGLHAQLLRADAEALPFANETFDLVYSWGVLHHTPDTAKAIAEVKRVLAGGGEARIMLYSRRSWTALWNWVRHAVLVGHPARTFGEVLFEHMESPGTKAYSTAELEAFFADWNSVAIHRWLTPYDCRFVPALVRAAGDRFGWFAGITARKP